VLLGDVEVDGAVRRGHPQHAGAELGLDPAVRHHPDRDGRPLRPGDVERLPDELLVALVVRVDGDGGVAELGLRPAGADERP
jgi:hypothetical protein